MKERYKTIPVDLKTHQKLVYIRDFLQLGKRAHGAIVRRLINAEYQKIKELSLSTPRTEEA